MFLQSITDLAIQQVPKVPYVQDFGDGQKNENAIANDA